MKIKYYFVFCILFFISYIVTGCGTSNEQLKYEDDNCKIIVNMPTKWSGEIIEAHEGNESFEATPDSGIKLYVNGDIENSIYIFRQDGHISLANEDNGILFKFENGLTGIRYFQQIDERINSLIVLDSEMSFGISINMDKEVYTKYEDMIEHFLQEVKIEAK